MRYRDNSIFLTYWRHMVPWNLVTTSAANGLSALGCQTITWTTNVWLLIGSLGKHSGEISTKIKRVFFRECFSENIASKIWAIYKAWMSLTDDQSSVWTSQQLYWLYLLFLCPITVISFATSTGREPLVIWKCLIQQNGEVSTCVWYDHVYWRLAWWEDGCMRPVCGVCGYSLPYWWPYKHSETWKSIYKITTTPGSGLIKNASDMNKMPFTKAKYHPW